MAFDDELEELESGCETEAEQIDEETEIEDVESQLDDDYMDPNSMASDLEEAYEGFMENRGAKSRSAQSEGEAVMEEAIRDETGMYLGENGYHVVDPYGDDDSADDLPSGGDMDDFDADELADEAEEVDELEPADGDYGFELVELDYDENDVVRYLKDEAGNDIGFVLLEDGKEVEYFYAEEDEDADEAYELVDIEVNDEDIVRYIVDDEDNEIGFVLEEDGREVEYYYAEEDEVDEKPKKSKKGDEFDLGITREGVAEATRDANDIYREGMAAAAEFKEAFDDIKSGLDFSFLKSAKKK